MWSFQHPQVPNSGKHSQFGKNEKPGPGGSDPPPSHGFTTSCPNVLNPVLSLGIALKASRHEVPFQKRILAKNCF